MQLCHVKLERSAFLKSYQNAFENAVSAIWISDLYEKACGTVEGALDLESEDPGLGCVGSSY